MIVSPPAEIGMRLAEVETLALLLDPDAFERNLARLAERATTMGVAISRLAHWAPVGGELDYLDEGTLSAALKARRAVR